MKAGLSVLSDVTPRGPEGLLKLPKAGRRWP